MRGLVALILIAAIIAVATYLADYPGQVEIVWQDWQVDTSVGVLLCAVLVAAALLWVLMSLLAGLVRLPRAVRRRARQQRERLGNRAITGGMLALAEGDGGEAERQARRAARFLPEAPLTLLLTAQAAQLGYDEAAAQRGYAAMLDYPALSFAGLRGLLAQAVRRGDDATALRLAEQARLLRPKSPWLTENLLALETRAGHWERAAATLETAARRGVVPAAAVRHHRGVILYEQSRAAEAAGDRASAAKLAGRAQAMAPDVAAIAAHHARLLLALGRKRAAAKAIERGWRAAPHPELAHAFEAVHAGDGPLARVAAFERLAALNPQALDSELAVAEAALAAQLWGEARRRLMRALAIVQPGAAPRRLCLLMARLEEGEHGDTAAARDWYDRAVAAPAAPRYLCAQCGRDSPEWRGRCPHCGGFDTLAWGAPAPSPPAQPSSSAPVPALAAPQPDPAASSD